MESSLKMLRTIQLAMLGSIALYVFLCERYGPSAKSIQPMVFYVIAVMAVVLIVVAVAVRQVMVKRHEAVLLARPDDKAGLRRWQSGYVLVYVLCEAVALYGVVLRFMGFSFAQVVPFFLAGFVLMLFLRPHRPSSIS
jgi:hypothetical protein